MKIVQCFFKIIYIALIVISSNAYSVSAVSKVYASDITYIMDNNYNINDVMKNKSWNSFVDGKFNLIINNSPLWIKFKGNKMLSDKLYLSLKNPLIDYVDVYIYQNESLVKNFQWGDHVKDAVYHGEYIEYFNIDTSKDVMYYAKIHSSGLIYLPFNVIDEVEFSKNSFVNNIVLGIFFGSLIFFVIYSIIMIIMAKEWLYLQYAGFTFSMLILYAYQEGIFIGMFNTVSGVHDYLYPLILSIVIAFCTIFNINYTQIKSYNKYYYYFMLSPLILSIICILSLPILTINQLTFFGLFNFQLIITASILCGIYLSFYKKNIEGMFLLSSLVCFIPGSTLYVAGIMGILETSFLPKYFIHVGHAIELLVWSIALGVKVYSMRYVISDQQRELHYNSLTKILNRKGLHSEVNNLINNKEINHFSVAILDIDHFKKINDGLGHAAGDDALVYFANFCNKNIREQDIIGRWGGEEFLLIMPSTNKYEAQELISRILTKMNNAPYVSKDYTIPLAFSAGVACADRDDVDDYDFTAMLHLADKHLYAAKNNGRNQVCV